MVYTLVGSTEELLSPCSRSLEMSFYFDKSCSSSSRAIRSPAAAAAAGGTGAHNSLDSGQSATACPSCGRLGSLTRITCGPSTSLTVCRTTSCLYPFVGEERRRDNGEGDAADDEAEAADEDEEEARGGGDKWQEMPHWLASGSDASGAEAALLTLLHSATVKATRLRPSCQLAECRRHFAAVGGVRLRTLLSVVAKATRPLTLETSEPSNELYLTLRRLVKGCRRLSRRLQSSFELRQVCCECFRHRVERHRSSVLRLTGMSDDFDLYNDSKRVFLRNCYNCEAPNQRMQLKWQRLDASSSSPSIGDALLLESPEGVRGLTVLRDLSIDGVKLLPSVLLQRSEWQPNAYVVWVRSRETSRWMRVPDDAGSCYSAVSKAMQDEPPVSEFRRRRPPSLTRESPAMAILFEREQLTVEAAVSGGVGGLEGGATPTASTTTTTTTAASGLGQVDELDALLCDLFDGQGLPGPGTATDAVAGTPPPTTPTLLTSTLAGSRSPRLRESSTMSEPTPRHSRVAPGRRGVVVDGLDASLPGRGFVLSRFLAETNGEGDGEGEERRLAGWGETSARREREEKEGDVVQVVGEESPHSRKRRQSATAETATSTSPSQQPPSTSGDSTKRPRTQLLASELAEMLQ